MTRTLRRLTAACGAALLSLALTACGAATATSPGIPATAPAGSAIATAPPADDATAGATADEDDPDDSGDDSSATASADGDKVSANTASEDEIAEALTAAGVTNPGRRAAEVVENRPYPTDDPDLTKLREKLAEDDLDNAATDRIVAALRP
ncbi:MAG: hypothetical protein QOK35_2778 [Pseudonocardiales bacterium]|nr:hypothetical protein [Pseudonocardiales bacterium]